MVLTSYGNEKKLWHPIASLGGFVPYLWSVYVVFYRGVWNSISDFSWMQLAAGLFYVLVGYGFLRSFWVLTELYKSIDKNKTTINGLAIDEIAETLGL